MNRVVEQRRVYPRPPIVEALVEFRFAQAVPLSKMRGALAGNLPHGYEKSPSVRYRIDLEAAVTGRDVRTAGKRNVEAYFFRGRSGLRLIGCRASSLSAHVLAPYPGWENFQDVVDECVAAAAPVLGSEVLKSVAVRYVDRIVIPGAAPNLQEFLTIAPRTPEGAGSILTGFSWTSETKLPATGDTMRVELRSAPPNGPEAQVVVLDLLAAHAFAGAVRLADRQLWSDIVDRLHQVQRDVFEASITAETRRLFE